MAKRGADNYLTDQNWDREDEQEEAGIFKPAGEAVLQKRAFKKAKRRSAVDPEAAEKPGAPVFKGFAGFTGFASSGSKPSFSFGASGSDKPSFGGGSKEKDAKDSTTDDKISGSGDKSRDSPAVAPPSGPVTSTPTEPQPKPLTNGNTSTMATSPKFLKMLKKLNESVLGWIDSNVKKNPYSILSPIFVDYDKYIEDLKKKYVNTDSESKDCTKETMSTVEVKEKDEKKEDTEKEASKKDPPSSTTSSSAGLFSFGSTTTNTSTAPLGSGGGSIFGGALKQTDTSPAKFSFGSPEKKSSTTTTAASGFTFGTASENKDKTSTTTSGFTFGASSDNKDNKAASGFTFGAKTGETSSGGAKFSFGSQPTGGDSAGKFSFGAAIAEKAADSGGDSQKEEEEYVPPKEDVKEVTEDDAFYSKRCKIFYKTDSGEWKERGIGNLHLKPCNENTQLVIRADTSLGNILLNIMLTKTMPINRQGKNNVMILCMPNPPIDPKATDPKPTSMLIRVKTGDDADELCEKMKSGKPADESA